MNGFKIEESSTDKRENTFTAFDKGIRISSSFTTTNGVKATMNTTVTIMDIFITLFFSLASTSAGIFIGTILAPKYSARII